MTSVGRALWGKGVSVRALTSADMAQLQKTLRTAPYVAELDADGHLAAITPATVTRQTNPRD
jgi:hypothetical protein